MSLTDLAVVYVREGLSTEALHTADLAFEEATQPNVRPSYSKVVVRAGYSIALTSGDVAAIAKWSQRGPNQIQK
jgi:hypothetical protein